MSADLPPDILAQILERLPAKSLLRFRPVSRSWNSLITSRQFIAGHLRRSIDAGHSSILLRHYSLARRRELNTVYRDRDGESLTEDQELEFPIRTQDTYYYVGECKGLLCLSDYLINYHRIVLWNPSIRVWYQVPIPRFIDTDITHTYILGFGFGRRTDQHKVVRLVYAVGRNYQRQIPPEVEVFALGTDKWRRIEAAAATDVPYVVLESSPQAFLNDAVHWIGYKRHNNSNSNSIAIVVFDFNEEKFQGIEIPSTLIHPNANRLSVAVFGDSLCLLEYDPWVDGGVQNGVVFVWVMEKYGVESSWSRRFVVDMRGRGGLKKVAGFRNGGEILAVDGNEELVSYDPESRRIERLGLRGIGRSFEAIPHIECLVLLKGADGFAIPVL